MSDRRPPAPEFSRIIELDDLAEDAREIEITADEAERAALASRFDLPAIERLSAKLTLCWVEHDKVLSLSGRLDAKVTQTCVVTLEPVQAPVSEEINLVFARDIEASADIVSPDEAEPLEGDAVDVGEIVAEELLLSLDPYPRRADIDPASIELGPGASLLQEGEADAEAGKTNPFAVLADLKPKQ